jgi:hypothetical protein
MVRCWQGSTMNESSMTALPLCQAMPALAFPAWSRPAISNWMQLK